MQNYQATIQSKFNSAPTMLALLASMNDAIDPTADLNAFFINVMNIDTATGYGLDVWGRRVVVSRYLQVETLVNFGFSGPDGSSGLPFGQAPFYNGQPITANYALADAPYRVLIYAKALANITDGSIPSINQILLNLFPGRGRCYVTDGQNMTMTYTFEFELTPVELAIVSQSGVLPRPAGVKATVVTP